MNLASHKEKEKRFKLEDKALIKNKKKKSLMDQLTGLVLLAFAVGVLVMIGVVIKEKMPKKAEPEPVKTVSGTSVSQS